MIYDYSNHNTLTAYRNLFKEGNGRLVVYNEYIHICVYKLDTAGYYPFMYKGLKVKMTIYNSDWLNFKRSWINNVKDYIR